MSKRKEVKLDALLGKHKLDAVDTFIEKVSRYGDYFEDTNAIRFRLDGVCYTALENPSDGYRSSMETLYVSREKMKNTFKPVEVVGTKKIGDYCTEDVLVLIDAKTGKPVLEVGTHNADDYYPSFVSSFSPENLCINQKADAKSD